MTRVAAGFAVRIVRAALVVGADDACSSSVEAFFGRPLVAFLGGEGLSSGSKLASSSSGLVFRFAARVLALAAGADFALTAAVMILVVLTVPPVALAAALARVMRLGGEFMVQLARRFGDGVQDCCVESRTCTGSIGGQIREVGIVGLMITARRLAMLWLLVARGLTDGRLMSIVK